jgi:hypothetical protein
MPEPDRILLILRELRDEVRSNTVQLRSIQSRLDFEFSEIHDRLRRLDERIDGFFTRVEVLEKR